jgi:hypothetical protein
LIDAIILLLSAAVVWTVAREIPQYLAKMLFASSKGAIVALPTFVPGGMIVAGVLFELSISSRFASSDSINWLPVTQTEYVAASAFSICFIYSTFLALALGGTLPLAILTGMQQLWVFAAGMTVLSFFMAGLFIEMLRAVVNRLSSVVYKTAGRGTVVIRLATTVGVIVALQLAFNPIILINLSSDFGSFVTIASVVPVLWASLAVAEAESGNSLASALFASLAGGFALVVLRASVTMRTRYWSPAPVSVRITNRAYMPARSRLESFGLTQAGSAIVRKDLKGLTRRRELISLLAIPFVFVGIFFIQGLYSGGSAAPGRGAPASIVLIGVALFSMMISSSSFGQEGTAVQNLYALPVSSSEILRAKLFTALSITLPVGLALSILASLISGAGVAAIAILALLSVALVLEQSLLGLALGSRYPDFREGPRPRFVEPVPLMGGVLLSMLVAALTAIPISLVLDPNLSGIITLSLPIVFGVDLVVALTVSILALRLARSGSKKLMLELTR